jgi:hypothetical protein
MPTPWRPSVSAPSDASGWPLRVGYAWRAQDDSTEDGGGGGGGGGGVGRRRLRGELAETDGGYYDYFYDDPGGESSGSTDWRPTVGGGCTPAT